MKTLNICGLGLIGLGILLWMGLLPINIQGAVVQFIKPPQMVSWNFPGTSTSPTIIPPGDFTPEVLVEIDLDTKVDTWASVCTIDGNEWWAQWNQNEPEKVYAGNLVTRAGQKHHITFSIVFRRISDGSATTLTADGYIQGGSASGTWYLNSYNLNNLGDYEVLQIPYSGAVTLKFVASNGGEYVESAYFKIWKHVLDRDVTQYESYPPDWTVVLTEVTADSVWSSSWTPPSPGTYVMYGYITMSGKDYRQLSVMPTLGGGGWFGVNQIVGLVSVAMGIVIATKK